MNKNKGIIGIGLILAIVLGVAIVGGGAYYLGKNKENVNIEKTPENILPATNEEQNLPIAENPQTAQVSIECVPTSQPFVKVLSPDGGEVFTIGDTIAVKWESCNVSSDTNDLFIVLHQNGEWKNVIYLDNATLNDGSESFTISSDVPAGNYKVRIGSPAAKILQDFSDNLFTINSKKTILTTLPKYYVGTHSDCNGLSSCWPPIVSNSSALYSCGPIKNQGDTTYGVEQKNINGRNYCVERSGDSFAGGVGWKYTYTTANGNGTKTTTFGLTYQSCGVYGRSGESQYNECKNAQSNFSANLDNLIDSLMQAS